MKGSTPLDNAAVFSLPCIWLLMHNIINKNAKEILHSKIDFITRGGKVFFPASLSLGIYDQHLPI